MSELVTKAETMPAQQQNNMQVVSQSERLMTAIVESNDVDRITKMYELYAKVRNDEAEISYKAAMAATQAAIPSIVKNRKNTHTNSEYADLGAILQGVLPIAGANGLSMSFEEDQEYSEQGSVKVIGTLSHRDGHSKIFPLAMPLDGAGMQGKANKTPIHAKASTISYCERYIYAMAYSIPIADNDGNNGQKALAQQTPEYFDLVAGLEKFAAAGTDALRDAWEALSKEQKILASPEMLRLKRDAAKVILTKETEEAGNG